MAIDSIRRRKETIMSFSDISETKEVKEDVFGNSIDDDWNIFEEKNVEKISSERLLTMISQLAPSYRLIFNLYSLEGYSHKEIAEKLSISKGTSKSNLFRAREN